MEQYDETNVLPDEPGVETLSIRYDEQDEEYLATVGASCDTDQVDTVLEEFGYTGDTAVAPSKLVLRADAAHDDPTMLEELEAVRSLGAVALTAAGYESVDLQDYAAEFEDHFGDDTAAHDYTLDTDVEYRSETVGGERLL